MRKEENTIDCLGKICAVLVKPKEPRNVGFACRALKTMGITRLRIVGSPSFDFKRAAVTAVHAKDLLDPAQIYPSLPAALADVSLAAGITRRRGKMRKSHSLLPEDFARHALQIKTGMAAMVFGTEEYGLTDEELSYCNCAVHIPSSRLFPSLNLSHAVQILGYAFFREAESSSIPRFRPIDGRQLALLVSHIIEYLRPLNYFKLAEAQSLSVLLGDVFARACLSKGEARRLERIFQKINGLFIRQKKKAMPSRLTTGAKLDTLKNAGD
ncbi:MAG: RNA methyltransferase [Spirochaetales bacterium]|nr:RNA methyltransferase [Spirochaetales bacterium]